MASFNRVVLMGNLARDPELRYAQGNNIAVVRTAIAVNRRYKDKEEVMFIDLVVFGKQAETLSTYAKKGTQVLVEGRLQQNTWEDPNGQKRSKHEVLVEGFQLIGGGKDADSRGGSNDAYGRKNERSGSSDICQDCGNTRDLCTCDIPF